MPRTAGAFIQCAVHKYNECACATAIFRTNVTLYSLCYSDLLPHDYQSMSSFVSKSFKNILDTLIKSFQMSNFYVDLHNMIINIIHPVDS